MIYYRCKCGEKEAWASYTPSKCDGCVKCKTTLEQSSDRHKEPVDHDWVTRYDEYNGKPYKRCKRCMKIQEAHEQV